MERWLTGLFQSPVERGQMPLGGEVGSSQGESGGPSDPRQARGRRHPWPAVLLLIVVGLLSGAKSQRALARWGQQAGWTALRRLGFVRPGWLSLATVHRTLVALGVAQLEALLGAWLQQGCGPGSERRPLAGRDRRRRKTLRDAHLLSACCQRRGLVLAEVVVPGATNELGAVGLLLERLVLDGETVTFDVAFTQWAVARQVVAGGGPS